MENACAATSLDNEIDADIGAEPTGESETPDAESLAAVIDGQALAVQLAQAAARM